MLLNSCRWLQHPKSPEKNVWVCRSRLSWLFSRSRVATMREVRAYELWLTANRRG